MRIFIGFDDTDMVGSEMGTGKLARRFEGMLPPGCRVWGVVRQQLLVRPEIPYTSHNSAACVVVETENGVSVPDLVDRAADHIADRATPGSDPGLCARAEDGPGMADLVDFGLACTRRVATQQEAMAAASKAHLSAHGGTGDGIIGSAAAVGLTASGWCGRFIEFGALRDLGETVTVSDLTARRIQAVSIDRDAKVPSPSDRVVTRNWVRPRLFGGRAVLVVRPLSDGVWENIGEKRRKNGHPVPPPPA